MPDNDPLEFVRMTHAKTDAISGRVTRKAFDEIYQAKGWKLATKAETEAADQAEGDPSNPIALKSNVQSAAASATK